MNLIITLAVGEPKYGQLALNLALSIKANNPNQKLLLIHEPSAVKGIEELIAKYFDNLVVKTRQYETATEFAFGLKTQLYKIATEAVPEAKSFIFLDADTIMLPGKSSDEWFAKHEGRPFTAYCNDILDFKTGKRKRKDYTFWCEPEVAKQQLGFTDDAKMPQINSSFLYFERCQLAEHYFKVVANIWNSDEVTYKKYKETKPDELCFNCASALTNILPHQNTYRPVFFQFGSEQQNLPYIFQYYKAMGFAGESYPYDYLVKAYNDISDYYRSHFGVIDRFIFEPATKVFRDKEPLNILPLKRRTIFRQGEVANSNGGIFNPDAVITNEGSLMTIMRKEVDYDVYKTAYSNSTAIPFVYYNESNYQDLKFTGYPSNVRMEDFRLFCVEDKILCNHKLIINNTMNNRDMKTCLATVTDDSLNCIGIPELPTKLAKMDINWTFFSEKKNLYCIYSLSPYKLFVASADTGYKKWTEVPVAKPELEWFHKEQFLSNSTNPILIDDHYLTFFHTKFGGIYHHGACLINKETKEIEYYTKNSIPLSSDTEGRQRGLLYVSGSVFLERENVVRLLFGTADSHSEYADYHKDKLIQEIKRTHV